MSLLEVILALGLLTLVTSMTYWFYSSSLRTNREGAARARRIRLSRAVLDRIAGEIRQAATITTEQQVGLRGGAEQIGITSYRVPRRDVNPDRSRSDVPPPAEYDMTRVEYHIVRHPEVKHPDGYDLPLGLARVETKIPRRVPVASPSSTGDGAGGGASQDGIDRADDLFVNNGSEDEGTTASRGADLGPQINWDELYAPEIRYLRFCYYDGSKWWDTWDITGESPLPQLVMVTIGYEPQPPFGEKQLGLDDVNERFCTCLSEDPVDCEPLAPDQLSTVVRLPQSDPLFRSRITRESQDVIEKLSEGAEEEGDGGP